MERRYYNGATAAEVFSPNGWQQLASSDPAKFLQSAPGLDAGGAEYLASLGVPRFEGAVQMVINPIAIR